MQGHRSSVSALPENLSFDHGSTSSDAGIDPQMPWNNMQTSAQNRLPEYRISSSETNIQYLHHVEHEGLNGEWSLGESSSSAAQSQGDPNERKREHAWGLQSGAARAVDERQYESSNILSLENVDVNANGDQTADRSSLLQISGHDVLPQDLNMRSESGDREEDEYHVERPNTYISIGSSSRLMPSSGGSSDSFGVHSGCDGYVMEESEDRPGCSLDGRRISCKRKALEVHVGQSSGAGSSNCFPHSERSQWHAVPPAQIAASNISTTTQTEGELVINNGLEQNNPRLRLGVGGAVSADPFSLTATMPESSRTNFRLRINGLHQQDQMSSNPYPMEADAGNADASSSRHSSRVVLRNRLFDLHSAPVVENGSLRAQSFLSHVPSVRRNPQSRWSGASSSRTNISSASAISGERDPMLYEDYTSRNIPRSISENPVFVPAGEMGSSSQQTRNWNLTGGSNSIPGNVASTSRQGSSSGVNSSAPTWSHRGCPQYPRRLSEIVRRSLLSSAGTEYGGQSSGHAIRSSPSAASQEMPLPSGSGSQGHHASNSRSALLERHLDGALGIPYSLRSLAAASEGRSSIMSEIRHVLDLMRRGEGLRFEDVMILDHSIFFGMADIHDRHRDMRMDVDNMSYEELLALEERIGNVCTGLKEETIMSRLKQQKFVGKKADGQSETEPCSICREEYNEGEDIGTLECGHDFHRDCIKQWLMHKNLCPICKTTGLTT
ncbi:probable E3 ubiquitin-protein ligase RHG1A [Sesamum indicum]|uniref:RING-type E3 ubiquitin transferase n=1 Tax=Sesamum indicum TaxID=4182 RepID=A0A8M8UPC4_SESIN|nr:probable E3 ubiquitin-protein ligase RHG1A [Sesamum indicum]